MALVSYYIQTYEQKYDTKAKKWYLAESTKVEAQAEEGTVFTYENQNVVLDEVASITESQAKLQRTPFFKYQNDEGKLLGLVTADPPLTIEINYLQWYQVSFSRDDGGIAPPSSQVYVETLYTMPRATGEDYNSSIGKIYNSEKIEANLLKTFIREAQTNWLADGATYIGGNTYYINKNTACVLGAPTYTFIGNVLDDIISPVRVDELTENPAYSVSLNLQGGLGPETDAREVRGFISYAFDGWGEKKNGSTELTPYLPGAAVEDLETVIYPIWSVRSVSTTIASIMDGIADPVRQSYRFLGWSTSPYSLVQQPISGNTTSITYIILYAIWQSELEYVNEFEQTLRKVPYVLEIWEDQFNSETEQWEEIKLVRLGADTMEDPARAFNITLKQTVYGELTLVFSLYGVYIDVQTGEKVENYLTNYCFNEAKVKLKYDNDWYDFIIKNIQETHNTSLTKTYTCQYLPIYELSKTGYSKVFSLESQDGSGIQSASDFMEDVLEETEWRYLSAGTPDTVAEDFELDLSETNEEVVYKTNVIADAPVSYTKFVIDSDGQLVKGEAFTTSMGTLYMPISQLNESGECFVCVSAEDIKLDGDLILKESLVLASIDSIAYPLKNFSITQYTVEVPKKSAVSKWIDCKTDDGGEITQYCNKGTIDGAEAYYRVKTATTDYATKYSTTADKYPCFAGMVDSQVYATQKQRIEEIGSASDDLYFAFTHNDNYYLFSRSDLNAIASPTIVELPVGTSYQFFFQSIGSENSIVGIIGSVGSKDETTPALTKDQWTLAMTAKTRYTIGEEQVLFLPLTKITWDETTDTGRAQVAKLRRAVILPTSPKTYYQKINSTADADPYYRPYTDCAIPSSKNFPTNFYEANIDMEQLSMNSNSVHSVRQYFKLNTTEVGTTAEIIGSAPATEENSVYIVDDNGMYYYDLQSLEYTLIQPPSWKNEDSRYTKKTFIPDESYIMYRSMEASASNCFDLTQSVAETFEVWCRYVIEHDDEGRIKYDDTGRRKKWVILTTYAGKDNPVGFTYGINLKNLQRDIKTDSLVTKLYVDYSENDYTSKGYIAISDAKDNISKENILYNFDYFIQVGLLDKLQVYNDLYKIENESDEDPVLIKCCVEQSGADGAGYLRLLGLLNTQYDTIVETINGETGYSYQITHLKEMISAYEYASAVTDDGKSASLSGNTASDSETLQKLKQEYNNALAQYGIAQKQLKRILERKSEIEQAFNQRYARYIQEGNWTSSSYVDSNTYYSDALKVSNDGAKPNVSYTFTAIDLYAIPEYKYYKFSIGDITWVEDPDYFGYDEDGTPYHESVILTEINYNLDNPSATTFSVQNYSTQFEDLFQSLSATAQSFSLNQQMYGRASKLLTSGNLDKSTIQKSLTNNGELTLMQSSAIMFDNNGLMITNVGNPNEVIRVASNGISTSTDGGKTFKSFSTGGGGSGSSTDAKPQIGSITTGTVWNSVSDGVYSQPISLTGVTAKSMITLQPDYSIISTLYEVGVYQMYVENDGGSLTLYATNNYPTDSLIIQCQIEETQ